MFYNKMCTMLCNCMEGSAALCTSIIYLQLQIIDIYRSLPTFITHLYFQNYARDIKVGLQPQKDIKTTKMCVRRGLQVVQRDEHFSRGVDMGLKESGEPFRTYLELSGPL